MAEIKLLRCPCGGEKWVDLSDPRPGDPICPLCGREMAPVEEEAEGESAERDK